MTYAIRAGKKIKLKAKKETELAVNYGSFLLQNVGAGSVYFKEKGFDEAAATEENGFMLKSGETVPVVLSAKTLSLMSPTDGEVSLLFVDER